jgi:hypothetical protein
MPERNRAALPGRRGADPGPHCDESPSGARRPSPVGRTALAFLATLALAFSILACGKSGPRDGTLCAHCGNSEKANCSNAAVVPEEDLSFFCGDADAASCNICSPNPSQTGYVCAVPTLCDHQAHHPKAQRCYPLGADNKLVPNFQCDGDEPLL